MILFVRLQFLYLLHHLLSKGLHIFEIVAAVLVMVQTVEETKVLHIELEILRQLNLQNVTDHHEVSTF